LTIESVPERIINEAQASLTKEPTIHISDLD
jgi:hypothetical protein